MTKAAEQVLRDALDLDDSERADVAAALLESLEPAADEQEIEQAWREEVQRRVAAVESGQAAFVPWEAVRDQLLARLHGRS